MSWNQFHTIESAEALIGRLYLEGNTNFKIVKREKVASIPDMDKALYDYNYPIALEHVTIEFPPVDAKNNPTKGMPKIVKYIPQIYREEFTDDTGYTFWKYFPENEKVKVEIIDLLIDSDLLTDSDLFPHCSI